MDWMWVVKKRSQGYTMAWGLCNGKNGVAIDL